MAVKCVAVHAGYVESSALGVVLFMHGVGYDTAEEAVRSLADGILVKFQQETGYGEPPSKTCCKKTLENDPEALYCSKCRSEIGETAFDFEQHEGQVLQLLNGTADSFGGTEIWGLLPEDEASEWRPWVSIEDVMELKPSEVVEIGSYGERVLTAMISPERIPPKDREAFQKWVKAVYFDNEDRRKLGLPLYRN